MKEANYDMKTLYAAVAVAVVALTTCSASFADYTWTQGPWQLTPPDAPAFNVAFSVLNNGDAKQWTDGKGVTHDVWYYQWDVTLNTKPSGGYYQATDGTNSYYLEAFKGFAFDLAGNTSGEPIVDGGAWGPDGDLGWKFQPKDNSGAGGSWTGDGPTSYLYADEKGHFKAGVWLDTLFQPGTNYDVQMHVVGPSTTNPDSVGTGFVQYQTTLLPSPVDPGEVTPELSSSALMLLGALPIGLAWWRRRKQ